MSLNENILRHNMEQLLKAELRTILLRTRAELGLTQNKMSDRYIMSEDSYYDLESGKYMCGTLTAILLLNDQANPKAILNEIAAKLEKLKEEELLPI